MKRFTITQFRAAYPNDDACLDKIFKLRFTNLVCPKCENDKEFTRVKNRRSYQCPCCGFQVYPTKDTVFEKTTTPLIYWFYAIYLQTTTRNGVAAKELERQLNVCYKTALRMAHQIKKLMANKNTEPLTGMVEIDETYLAGDLGNKHKWQREQYKGKSTGITHKQPILGMLERGGRIVAIKVPATDGATLKPIIRQHLAKGATMITDGHGAYRDMEYNHEALSHHKGEYARGEYNTNSLEGFWAQLKRTIKGTHISVSKEHLQKYIDEVAFRYMHRSKQDAMFEIILSYVV
jgi:transposase